MNLGKLCYSLKGPGAAFNYHPGDMRDTFRLITYLSAQIEIPPVMMLHRRCPREITDRDVNNLL